MKALACVLNLLIPGWGYLVLNRTRTACLVQFLLISGVLTICLSRAVITPQGFYCLLLFIVAVHLFVFLFSFRTQAAQQINNHFHLIFRTILFPLSFITIATVFYSLRESLLGFNVYHIPSQSMAPTLLPGNYVIVDTWINDNGDLENNIVIFKKEGDERVLIKRIKKIDINQSKRQQRFFVQGDNSNQSIDSRHFGPIPRSAIKGIATGIIFSLNPTPHFKLQRLK